MSTFLLKLDENTLASCFGPADKTFCAEPEA
jgi:hypothetical protein